MNAPWFYLLHLTHTEAQQVEARHPCPGDGLDAANLQLLQKQFLQIRELDAFDVELGAVDAVDGEFFASPFFDERQSALHCLRRKVLGD